MVYCGLLSRGCQRCRKRKVKCDQRKPGCSKCEKSGLQCSGYRNLEEFMFRDESKRVLQKFSGRQPTFSSKQDTTTQTLQTGFQAKSTLRADLQLGRIPASISPSIYELGVNFFFAKYTFNEEPFFNGYHAWLAESYLRPDTNNVLRALIEAVGLAGLSNVSYAADLESKSKERYCNALTTLKEGLNDPALAPEDTTLMAVILLILFEIVNFNTWNRYHCWVAHVRAATALLELRGREQFNRERAGQLYVQSRSHILLACVQQYTSVPFGLVQTTYGFQSSATRQQWQKRKIASPGSISEIAFRTINLRAALKNRELTDHAVIRATALAIDSDIETWRAALPPSWGYVTTEKLENVPGSFHPESTHTYANNWIADAWNNWRTLNIIIKQIILENERGVMNPDQAQISGAEAVIRQMSIDICVSIHSFRDNPRILAMIQPLYFVALTELNTSAVRAFAVERLRSIAASTGVLQAALLADTAAKSISKSANGFHVS